MRDGWNEELFQLHVGQLDRAIAMLPTIITESSIGNVTATVPQLILLVSVAGCRGAPVQNWRKALVLAARVRRHALLSAILGRDDHGNLRPRVAASSLLQFIDSFQVAAARKKTAEKVVYETRENKYINT